MARDLKSRGFSSYNADRFRNYSVSPIGSNLTSRDYPGSTGINSGNIGVTTTALKPRNTSTGSTKKTGGVSGFSANLSSMFQKNPWDDYLNQRNSLAQAAYDKGMGALDAAFGEYMAALANNLESAKGALEDSYGRSKQNIAEDAAQSLKQAYINKMLSAKNFDQQMSAQGISGGASETTRAAMSNNYGNARNDINAQKARNLSELEGQYNDNIAQAYQAYNQAMAQAQLQKAMQAIELENMLADGQIAALDDYYSLMDKYGGFGSLGDFSAQMSGIGGGLDNYEFSPTEAKNTVSTPEVIQSQNNGADQRDYSNLLVALQALMNKANGNGMPTAMNSNYLNALLSQLRGAR